MALLAVADMVGCDRPNWISLRLAKVIGGTIRTAAIDTFSGNVTIVYRMLIKL